MLLRLVRTVGTGQVNPSVSSRPMAHPISSSPARKSSVHVLADAKEVSRRLVVAGYGGALFQVVSSDGDQQGEVYESDG